MTETPYEQYDDQPPDEDEKAKQVIKQAINEYAQENQPPDEDVTTVPQNVIDEKYKRLPPVARSTTELMQSIIEPTLDPNKPYDSYHAIKDWDLTYTKTDEQVQYLMLYGQLTTQLHHWDLQEAAQAINAEAKRYAALLRSRDFAQQREIRSFRQYMEGKEKKEKKHAGLFNKVTGNKEE